MSTPEPFDPRETATVGMLIRLIEAARSRYRAGLMDAADGAEVYLQGNYSVLQRAAAPKALKERK